MTAPLPDPPTPADRSPDGDGRRIEEPAAVPENLVIPPKPPLPVPGEPEPAGDTSGEHDRDRADSAASADSEVVAEPEREAVADLDPVADAEPVANTEPDSDAEPVADAEPDADAESGSTASEPGSSIAGPGWLDADESLADSAVGSEPALVLENVTKRFGATAAVDDISLRIEAGTFYGLVGPNGAGKTTTLSMIAGLLRADAGEIRICGLDARAHEREAKRLIGVLPDRLRTFDRLTGRQLLTYAGLLRGLDGPIVEQRVDSLARALDLEAALGRIVADYSAGMTKKVMLAAAMIHAPRLLVLDEPFEALDPASAAVILDILRGYTAQGGTVVLSSHGMDLIERVCDRVAVLAAGRVLAEGTIDDVRGGATLAERFVEIVGGAGEAGEAEGLEWLHNSSD